MDVKNTPALGGSEKKEPSLRLEDVEAIYELFSERIYKFFYFKFTSKQIAEDLTSETFMAFL
jgi:DNA-directed RNA polymerase specialized sigma24 family protein